MYNVIKITTCGKLIIAGEHSVLYGYSAISIGINRRVDVLIEFVVKKKVSIFSDIYGNIIFSKNEIEDIFVRKKSICKKHEWVLPILFLVFKNVKDCGVILKITSNIENVGFGSSGAIFSAVSCGLLLLNNGKRQKKTLLKKTIQFQQDYVVWLREYSNKNMFMPSGVDLATSIYGGTILFNGKSKQASPFPADLIKKTGVFAIYSGHKTSTDDTIERISRNKKVLEYYKNIDNIVEKISSNMNEFNTENSEKALNEFYKNISLNQNILEILNLADSDINNIITACKKDNVSAKISGSGLGDCVIVFAKFKDIKKKYKNIAMLLNKYKFLEIKIDNKGLKYKIIK